MKAYDCMSGGNANYSYRDELKTTELTRLQMGRDIESTPEKTLNVSTIAELEGLVPFLKSCERDQPVADVSS